MNQINNNNDNNENYMQHQNEDIDYNDSKCNDGINLDIRNYLENVYTNNVKLADNQNKNQTKGNSNTNQSNTNYNTYSNNNKENNNNNNRKNNNFQAKKNCIELELYSDSHKIKEKKENIDFLVSNMLF